MPGHRSANFSQAGKIADITYCDDGVVLYIQLRGISGKRWIFFDYELQRRILIGLCPLVAFKYTQVYNLLTTKSIIMNGAPIIAESSQRT